MENATQEQLLIDLHQSVQELNSLNPDFEYSLTFNLKGGGSIESRKSDGAIGNSFHFEDIEAGRWMVQGAIDALKEKLNAEDNRKKFFEKVSDEDVNRLVRLHELASRINKLDQSGKDSLVFDLSDGGGRLIRHHRSQKGGVGSIVTTWKDLGEGVEKLRGVLDGTLDYLAAEKERFYRKLRGGGAIVAANSCTEEEIAIAKKVDRFFVDEEGFGCIYRLPEHLDVVDIGITGER